MWRALLIILILLLLPEVAAADRWRPEVVQRALTVADGHWPDSPCRAAHQIEWMTALQLYERFPDDPYAVARGEVGGCRVWIAWDRIDPANIYRPGVFLCAVLEHEFGHNAGLEHSSNPRDPMFPTITFIAPDCRAAFAPPASLGSLRWGRVRLPARAAGLAHLGHHGRYVLHGVL